MYIRVKESNYNRPKKVNWRWRSKKDKAKTKWFHSKRIIGKVEKNLPRKWKIRKANNWEKYINRETQWREIRNEINDGRV